MKCLIIHFFAVGGVAAYLGLDLPRRTDIEPAHGRLRARHIDHELFPRQPKENPRSRTTPQSSDTGGSARVAPQGAGPSNPSQQGKQAGSSRQRRPRVSDSFSRQVANLRITQSSGAEPSTTHQSSGNPGPGRARSPEGVSAPRNPPPFAGSLEPTARLHTFSQAPASSSRSEQAPGSGGTIPPASRRGPPWLENERQTIQGYRQGFIRRPTADERPRDRQAKAAGLRSVEVIDRLKPLAQDARRQDDKDLQEYRSRLASGLPTQHPLIMLARDQSMESSRRAYHMTRAHSNAQEGVAVALADVGRFDEAVIHRQKANRAYQRADLRHQHAETLDLKWLSQASKESIRANADKPIEDRKKAVKSAVNVTKSYKTNAEKYHQTYDDYQQVRQEFDGSSSDESEKSTFDDIAPRINRANPKPGR